MNTRTQTETVDSHKYILCNKKEMKLKEKESKEIRIIKKGQSVRAHSRQIMKSKCLKGGICAS